MKKSSGPVSVKEAGFHGDGTPPMACGKKGKGETTYGRKSQEPILRATRLPVLPVQQIVVIIC